MKQTKTNKARKLRQKKRYEIVGDRISTGISYFIRISLIAAIIIAAFESRWTVIFVSLLCLILTFIPSMIEKRHDISIPTEFEIAFMIFIYGSLYLGEVHNYYTRFWWWDTLLHGMSGMVLGLIGFMMIYILYTKHKVKASPSTISFFAFGFALSLGALWEIAEFTLDNLLGWNMQKSSLNDTMWDLIVDSAGALISALLGYGYIKKNKGYGIDRMITNFLKKNPSLIPKQKN